MQTGTVLSQDTVLEAFENEGACSCGSHFFILTKATLPPFTLPGFDCIQCGAYHQELPEDSD